ncbi:MAG TPA: efflux RND transporter periplasmic adaptor subunit [Terriglobales bacterium]
MTNIVRTRVLLAAVAAVACAGAGCSKSEKEKEPVVTVQVQPAKTGPMTQVVTADAVIYPLEQAALSAKITAPVKRFYVRPGSHVKGGELLATLENQDLEAATLDSRGQFEQAEASYQTATASSIPEEMQKAQLDVANAKQALDAQQKLYKSRQELFEKGALPRKDVDQAQVALVQAQSQYDIAARHLQSIEKVNGAQEVKAATGQLSSAKGKYLNAQAQLSYSEIRTPITGTVTQRTLYPGEIAQAGTPILTVVNNSQVVARAHLPQSEAMLLKVGDSATIRVPGAPDVDAKVTFVNAATDPNSTTIEVWVQAANKGGIIKPGLTGSITVTAKTVKDALIIPADAVEPGPDGGTVVMLAGSDDKAHQKSVTIGSRSGDQVQILDGVKVGDPVIVAGGYGLADNADIKVADDKGEGATAEKDDEKPDNEDGKKAEMAPKAAAKASNTTAADKDKQ